MLCTLMFAWGSADAAELRPFRDGDTVESMAIELGDPALAAEVRRLNDIAPGAQPAVGTLITLPPPLYDHGDQEAFVVQISGTVTIADPAGVEAPAVPFRSLAAGSMICTAERSFATLRVSAVCDATGDLADDIVLSSSTCVVVTSAFASAQGRSATVRVVGGSIQVAEVPGASGRLTVQTESGFTTGGAGGFRVHVEADAMRTEALTAEVAVIGAGEELVLDAGQGSRVRTGEGPSDPVELLRPSPLIDPSSGAVLRRPRFAWTDDPEAFGYRFEIAGNDPFTLLVYQQDVAEPVHEPAFLSLPFRASPSLYWRMAPLDRFGFLGLPSEARPFTLPQGVGP